MYAKRPQDYDALLEENRRLHLRAGRPLSIVFPIVRAAWYARRPFLAPLLMWAGPASICAMLAALATAYAPESVREPVAAPSAPPKDEQPHKKYPCYFVAHENTSDKAPWQTDWYVYNDDEGRSAYIDRRAGSFPSQLDAWNFLLKWKVETCK